MYVNKANSDAYFRRHTQVIGAYRLEKLLVYSTSFASTKHPGYREPLSSQCVMTLS